MSEVIESGNGSSPQDELILEAIANGSSQMVAAHLAKCSVRTVQRRLADPEIRAQLEEIRRTAREEIMGRLTQAASDAVEALWREVQDGEFPDVRVKAAAVLINSLVKVHQLFPKESVETTETIQRRRVVES